jgi:hypothetical protein
VCPFLEKADPRCSAHLNLRNIVRAFAHCAGHYDHCPLYAELHAGLDKYDHANLTTPFAFRVAS